MKEAKFYPVGVPGLDTRYFINNAGTIIDYGNDVYEQIYTYNRLEELKLFELINSKGEVEEYCPAELYLITYYGYLPGSITIRPKKALVYRYMWKVDSVESIEDSRDLIVNGVRFKYSEACDAHCSDSGCIIYKDNFVRHFIDAKLHHQVALKTTTFVHRVIYDAWKHKVESTKVIHHKNCKAWDNRLNNLQELTQKEHIQIHGPNSGGNIVYSDELVDECCRLMADGATALEASQATGIPEYMAVRYRGGARPEISKKYEYNKPVIRRHTKITEEEATKIYEMYFNGTSLNDIAESLGVGFGTVSQIVYKQRWVSVTDAMDARYKEQGLIRKPQRRTKSNVGKDSSISN